MFSRIKTKFRGYPELEDPVQEMIRISDNPILILRMPFGKNKGLLFSEVPPDYLEWLLTTELNEDVVYMVKKHLERVQTNDCRRSFYLVNFSKKNAKSPVKEKNLIEFDRFILFS